VIVPDFRVSESSETTATDLSDSGKSAEDRKEEEKEETERKEESKESQVGSSKKRSYSEVSERSRPYGKRKTALLADALIKAGAIMERPKPKKTATSSKRKAGEGFVSPEGRKKERNDPEEEGKPEEDAEDMGESINMLVGDDERQWLTSEEEEEEEEKKGEKEERKTQEVEVDEKEEQPEVESGEIIEVYATKNPPRPRLASKGAAKVHIPSRVRELDRKYDEKGQEQVYVLTGERGEIRNKLEKGAHTVKKVIVFRRGEGPKESIVDVSTYICSEEEERIDRGYLRKELEEWREMARKGREEIRRLQRREGDTEELMKGLDWWKEQARIKENGIQALLASEKDSAARYHQTLQDLQGWKEAANHAKADLRKKKEEEDQMLQEIDQWKNEAKESRIDAERKAREKQEIEIDWKKILHENERLKGEARNLESNMAEIQSEVKRLRAANGDLLRAKDRLQEEINKGKKREAKGVEEERKGRENSEDQGRGMATERRINVLEKQMEEVQDMKRRIQILEEKEMQREGKGTKSEERKPERNLQVVFELRNPLQTPIPDKKSKLCCTGTVSAENIRRINNALDARRYVVVANRALTQRGIALHVNGERTFHAGQAEYKIQLIQRSQAEGGPAVRPGSLKRLGETRGNFGQRDLEQVIIPVDIDGGWLSM
jgi:hypothetical protein